MKKTLIVNYDPENIFDILEIEEEDMMDYKNDLVGDLELFRGRAHVNFLTEEQLISIWNKYQFYKSTMKKSKKKEENKIMRFIC